MPPVGLLAIIALGMVVAYALPQRVKERSTYALVRTEDRYSADMRVVKTTAERIERPVDRPSTDSGSVPLLVTGAARAQVAAVSESAVSRPVTPLDKAATLAQREQLAIRRDRQAVRAERAARARRRARVAGVTFALAALAWLFVALGTFGAVYAAVATALFSGVVVMGARAAAAERAVDARLRPVIREVEAAATATGALRRVTRERAEGHYVDPSDVETQAIRVVTAEDLAPLAAPALVPPAVLPAVAEPAQEGAENAGAASADNAAAWTPREMPAPAYTLKQTVRPPVARPLTPEDFAASTAAAERALAEREAESDAVAQAASASRTQSAALDAILERRRNSA